MVAVSVMKSAQVEHNEYLNTTYSSAHEILDKNHIEGKHLTQVLNLTINLFLPTCFIVQSEFKKTLR